MPTPTQYIERIEYGDRFIKLRLEGLTHADTMKQLPFPTNCMNWHLGHIVVFRDVCLGAIAGAEGVSAADPAEYAIYGAGTDYLTDSAKALPLETLVERLAETSEQLKMVVGGLAPEQLNQLYESHTGPQKLDDYLLFYLVVHEAAHLGQLEILHKFAVG